MLRHNITMHILSEREQLQTSLLLTSELVRFGNVSHQQCHESVLGDSILGDRLFSAAESMSQGGVRGTRGGDARADGFYFECGDGSVARSAIDT